jgi:hypothetical protein
MSDAFHHVAVAALPVAIGLVVLTAIARALVNHERLGRLAREHLGALSTWCLILVAVYAAALGGAGDLSAGRVGAALVIGAAAVLLRAEYSGDEDEPADDDAPEWARPPAEPAATERSLWAEGDDEAARRTGLWA